MRNRRRGGRLSVPAAMMVDMQDTKSKKRKQIPGSKSDKDTSKSKKARPLKPNYSDVAKKEKVNSVKKKVFQSPSGGEKKNYSTSENKLKKEAPLSKKDRRLRAKELAKLWEKMRQRNIAKEDISKSISKALEQTMGKIPEIASSHVSSGVLQTCVKYGSEAERNAVFEELRPQCLPLASNTYAVHLVNKMLDSASKSQLAEFVSALHVHIGAFL